MEKRGGEGQDVLAGWLDARPCPGRASEDSGTGGVRFAFYGRTSTVEHQDPVSSRGWQREAADAVIGGHGRVVRGFFGLAAPSAEQQRVVVARAAQPIVPVAAVLGVCGRTVRM